MNKIVCVFLLVLCCNINEKNDFFEQTKEAIFSLPEDIRYYRPVTLSEYNDGVKEMVQLHPEGSLPDLRIYAHSKSIPRKFWQINNIKHKIPTDYFFVFSKKNSPKKYLNNNFKEYSFDNRHVTEVNNFDYLFSENFEHLENNWGGLMQFSDVLFNESFNKAVLFVRISVDDLNSSESLLLFKKQNQKWVLEKHILVSIS